MARNENQSDDDLEIDEIIGGDTERTRSGFTGAKLGRFAAVAFFLLLGTFAVIQSMNRLDPDKAKSDQADSEIAEPAGESTGKEDATLAEEKPQPKSIGLIGSSSIAKFAKSDKNPPNFSPSVDATKIFNASQAKPVGLPKAKAKSFGTDELPKPDDAAKTKPAFAARPPKVPQSLTAKKQDEPVVRVAQVPGKPIITSNGGFGELNKKPIKSNGFNPPEKSLKPISTSSKPTKFPPLPNASAKANGGTNFQGFSPPKQADNSLVKQTGDEAKKLLGNLADGGNALREEASSSLGAAEKKLGSLANQAGDRFNTARSNFQGAASKLTGGLGSRPPTGSTRSPQNGFAPPSQKDRGSLPPRQPLAGNELGQGLASSTNNNGFGSANKPAGLSPQRSSLGQNSLRGSGSTMRTPTTNVSNSARRLPATPASTGGARITGARPSNTMSTRTFPPNTGPRSLVGTSAPVARTASAATLDVPGDKRLDGMQAPSLTIEKFSPREIQVNQPSDFQIVIRNVGRVPVDDVQVFDQIPGGTEFISASPQPTQTNNRKLNWAIGTVNPGTEKRITLKLKPTRPGEIGSVAQMTFATRSSMRTRVTQPVLEITHRSKPQVLIGDDVIFDVVVTNRGDGPAKNVLIQEDVPEQLDFRQGFREIEFEVGTLMPNQSRTARLTLRAKKAGKLQNTIHVTGSGGLKSQHKIDMEVVSPKLKAAADGPTRRFLGRRAQHKFSVANGGTASATNVDLIAQLPSGLRYVNSNNKGTYDPNVHAVFWELAELGKGVSASVEVATEPIAVGNQPIKFEAKADLNLSDRVEQPLSVEHLVDVFFDIDDVADPIEIGSETLYQVQIVNQGTKPATNVRLQIDFPSGLKPTSVDGPLANDIRGQQILFSPIGNLKPGERVEFTVKGAGQAAGDHRVVVKMQTDGRSTPVAKEETTRVYSDR